MLPTPSSAGLRVVDLSGGYASAVATAYLAAVGADVILVEPLPGGSPLRTADPYAFAVLARESRSCAWDLDTDEGRRGLRDLVAGADVVIHGAVPPAGAGADGADGGVVHAYLTGFLGGADDGTENSGLFAQAASGLAALQDGVMRGTRWVEQVAGVNLAIGILAAVIKARRFGSAPERVSVDLVDAATIIQMAPIAEFTATGYMQAQADYANRFPLVGIFDANDGPFYLAAYWDRDWAAVITAIEAPELAQDPRFTDGPARSENREALKAILQQQFSTRSREEWIASMDDRSVMAGVFRDHDALLNSEQVAVNGSLQTAVGPHGAALVAARVPVSFDDLRRPPAPPPGLGAQTAEINAELGAVAEVAS